jgi:hypothetical protein
VVLPACIGMDLGPLLVPLLLLLAFSVAAPAAGLHSADHQADWTLRTATPSLLFCFLFFLFTQIISSQSFLFWKTNTVVKIIYLTFLLHVQC